MAWFYIISYIVSLKLQCIQFQLGNALSIQSVHETVWLIAFSRLQDTSAVPSRGKSDAKMRRGWGERGCHHPLPQIAHVLFSLCLFYFSQCPYYLRAWYSLQCGRQTVLGVRKVEIMEAVQREVSRKNQPDSLSLSTLHFKPLSTI